MSTENLSRPDTSRKLMAVEFVGKYRIVTRKQVQAGAEYDGKHADRACRRDLGDLVRDGLLAKSHVEVLANSAGATAPVYSLSHRGRELLAAEFGEEWLTVDITPVHWTLLRHATDVAEFFIRLDKAFGLQNQVELLRRLTEFDVANPQERDPSRRFKLYTELQRSPRLACIPDAGLLLQRGDDRKAYYLELSRGTSSTQQIAASKTPGYAGLAEARLHTKHFPETNIATFTVLFIEPSAGRRDLLWNALRKRCLKEAQETEPKKLRPRYLVAAWPDITPERVLFEPIWYGTDGVASPLVRRT